MLTPSKLSNRIKIKISVVIGYRNKLFTLIVDRNIPENSGVYFIQNENRRIVYVGQTTNFKRRLTEHFRSHIWFKYLARGAILIKLNSDSLNYLRRMETYYISVYRPIFNLEDGDVYYLTEKAQGYEKNYMEKTEMNTKECLPSYAMFKWQQYKHNEST